MQEVSTMRLRRDKRGVSNVIVVMLSLVLITIIVGNIIIWSYEMNQLDLERIQESLVITNVTSIAGSPWFTAQEEFATAVGIRQSGTFTDTKAMGGTYETFVEEKTRVFNPSTFVLGGSTKHVAGEISDLRANDGNYMRFQSYPNYEVEYQESIDISSTTSTEYQNKVSISFTPQTSATFMIIASAEVQGSNTNYQTKARLTVNSSTYQELLYRVKDPTDWYPSCGLKCLTMIGGANYIVRIQFCTNNAAGTAYIRNARLLILSAQSEYAESELLSTSSSTSWQDKVTLSFTSPADEDYLLIGSANYRGSSTSYEARVRLVQNGTTVHADTVGRPGSRTSANYYTFGVMRKISLAAGSHDFRIQYCSSSTAATAGINYAHLALIRLSQFDADYYAENEGESTTPASGVWYDKVVNTYTAQERSYLIMGSIAYQAGSTTYSVGLDFQTDSSSRLLPLVEHRAATSYESAFFMTKQNLTPGAKTDRLRWMGESTSARVKNARLISCMLPAQTQIVEVEFTGNSNTLNWAQLEWATDSSSTTENVTATYQLYNYQTSQFPDSGEGYMSTTIGSADSHVNQTITANPTRFRGIDGGWRLKIRCEKAVYLPFELNVDWVEFTPSLGTYRLDISNGFLIDLSASMASHVNSITIRIRYNVSHASERWFLKAYNWSASSYSDSGFNNTAGDQAVAGEWKEYTVSITSGWSDYVSGNDTVLVKLVDEGVSSDQTTVAIDFLAVSAVVDAVRLNLRNSSSFTVHVVAFWLVNSTSHQRYEVSLFVNSGESATYEYFGISYQESTMIVKVVTERGNISVFP
ncbi:MAG: hypothetical protein QHH24_01490 [Candidatus Bathyarchaeota archaeon]|nr:hypothetical protein [Candidatus Bathyarchaeota archaeon]